jgi:hypothetical protein
MRRDAHGELERNEGGSRIQMGVSSSSLASHYTANPGDVVFEKNHDGDHPNRPFDQSESSDRFFGKK